MWRLYSALSSKLFLEIVQPLGRGKRADDQRAESFNYARYRRSWGQRNGMMAKVLVLHMSNVGLIPDTLYGPVCLIRSDLLSTEQGVTQALLDVSQNIIY